MTMNQGPGCPDIFKLTPDEFSKPWAISVDGLFVCLKPDKWSDNSIHLLTTTQADHVKAHGGKLYEWHVVQRVVHNTVCFGFRNAYSGKWLGVNENGDVTCTASELSDWETWRTAGYINRDGMKFFYLSVLFKGNDRYLIQAQAGDELPFLKLADSDEPDPAYMVLFPPLFV
ncbi:Actin cross-linking [Penicillium griseofulvum]|uniref:Actin cross-linking n=1 Tax=Penicillium patulum TaxID=5078 RepID=A0A135L8P5_PENPA|nr:Actin cross-linking [Penicillium griseofulvum]KXG45332.1 Actin cross-linking [Penicillium griseofulvum]